jgi:hypothetical protein
MQALLLSAENEFEQFQYSIAYAVGVNYLSGEVGFVGDDIIDSEHHHLFHILTAVNSPYENSFAVLMSAVYDILIYEDVIEAHRVDRAQLRI